MAAPGPLAQATGLPGPFPDTPSRRESCRTSGGLLPGPSQGFGDSTPARSLAEERVLDSSAPFITRGPETLSRATLAYPWISPPPSRGDSLVCLTNVQTRRLKLSSSLYIAPELNNI